MIFIEQALQNAAASVNKRILVMYTQGKITKNELDAIVEIGRQYRYKVLAILADTTALEGDLFQDPVLDVLTDVQLILPRPRKELTSATKSPRTEEG